MSNNRKVFVILGIIVIMIIVFLLGIFVGKSDKNSEMQINSSLDSNVNAINNNVEQQNVSQTFYATIVEINEYQGNTTILVEGLEVNDINHRGKFTFQVTESTYLEWRNSEIDLLDLNVANNISITYKGEVLDSYPAQITEVINIQLLDDEK